MVSPWGKFLTPIIVPSALTWGWKEGLSAYTAQLPAGNYANIAALAGTLVDAMREESNDSGGGFTFLFNLSADSEVTIGMDDSGFGADWPNTDTELATLLGFDKTETVVATPLGSMDEYLTASAQHEYAWRPGKLSLLDGRGLAEDTEWLEDTELKGVQISGARVASNTGPEEYPQYRNISINQIKQAERVHITKGPRILFRTNGSVYWFEDRENGTITDATTAAEALTQLGTQGDPNEDTTADYWKVSVVEGTIARGGGRPDIYDVSVRFFGEAD